MELEQRELLKINIGIPKILTIGFAFSCQKINKLEINSFDKRLDVVLTEKSTKI